jgi:hypothetical protein
MAQRASLLAAMETLATQFLTQTTQWPTLPAPPRLTFQSDRLKTPEVKKSFKDTLESLITRASPRLTQLSADLQGKIISMQQYADEAEKLLTDAIHSSAYDLLQKVRPTYDRNPHTSDPTLQQMFFRFFVGTC